MDYKINIPIEYKGRENFDRIIEALKKTASEVGVSDRAFSSWQKAMDASTRAGYTFEGAMRRANTAVKEGYPSIDAFTDRLRSNIKELNNQAAAAERAMRTSKAASDAIIRNESELSRINSLSARAATATPVAPLGFLSTRQRALQERITLQGSGAIIDRPEDDNKYTARQRKLHEQIITDQQGFQDRYLAEQEKLADRAAKQRERESEREAALQKKQEQQNKKTHTDILAEQQGYLDKYEEQQERAAARAAELERRARVRQVTTPGFHFQPAGETGAPFSPIPSATNREFTAVRAFRDQLTGSIDSSRSLNVSGAEARTIRERLAHAAGSEAEEDLARIGDVERNRIIEGVLGDRFRQRAQETRRRPEATFSDRAETVSGRIGGRVLGYLSGAPGGGFIGSSVVQSLGLTGGQALAVGGAGVAALGIYEILKATDAVAKEAQGYSNLSKELGQSAQFMQVLGRVTEVTGVQTNGVLTVLKHLNEEITANGQASVRTRTALAELGLSAAVAFEKPESQLRTLLGALKNVGDQTERERLVVQLFGESGRQLLPLVDSFDKVAAAVQKTGAILSDAQIEKLAQYREAVQELKLEWESFKQSLALGTVGVLKFFVELDKKPNGQDNGGLSGNEFGQIGTFGALGAGLGSVVPVVGTAAGAGIGLAAGAGVVASGRLIAPSESNATNFLSETNQKLTDLTNRNVSGQIAEETIAGIKAGRVSRLHELNQVSGSPEDRINQQIADLKERLQVTGERYVEGRATDDDVASLNKAIAAKEEEKRVAAQIREQLQAIRKELLQPTRTLEQAHSIFDELSKRFNLITSSKEFRLLTDKVQPAARLFDTVQGAKEDEKNPDVQASTNPLFRRLQQAYEKEVAKQRTALTPNDRGELVSPFPIGYSTYSPITDLVRNQEKFRDKGVENTVRDQIARLQGELRDREAAIEQIQAVRQGPLQTEERLATPEQRARIEFTERQRQIGEEFLPRIKALGAESSASLEASEALPLGDEKKARLLTEAETKNDEAIRLTIDARTREIDAVNKFNEAIDQSTEKIRDEWASGISGIILGAQNGGARGAIQSTKSFFERQESTIVQNLIKTGLSGIGQNPLALGTGNKTLEKIFSGTIFGTTPPKERAPELDDNTRAILDGTQATKNLTSVFSTLKFPSSATGVSPLPAASGPLGVGTFPAQDVPAPFVTDDQLPISLPGYRAPFVPEPEKELIRRSIDDLHATVKADPLELSTGVPTGTHLVNKLDKLISVAGDSGPALTEEDANAIVTRIKNSNKMFFRTPDELRGDEFTNSYSRSGADSGLTLSTVPESALRGQSAIKVMKAVENDQIINTPQQGLTPNLVDAVTGSIPTSKMGLAGVIAAPLAGKLVAPLLKEGGAVLHSDDRILAQNPRIFVKQNGVMESETGSPIALHPDTSLPVNLPGTPIDHAKLPKSLYHVTTNAPAVQDSGVLLGKLSDNPTGLGGGLIPGVSFTNKKMALSIQRDLTRAVKLARNEDSIQDIYKYAEEDSGSVKSPLADNAGLRVAADEAVRGADRYATGNADEGGTIDSRAKNSFAHSVYLSSRSYYSHGQPGLRNPLILTDPAELAKINPDNIRTLKVPTRNIPKDALVTPGTDDFLKEIRAYSDVPINGSTVAGNSTLPFIAGTGAVGLGAFGALGSFGQKESSPSPVDLPFPLPGIRTPYVPSVNTPDSGGNNSYIPGEESRVSVGQTPTGFGPSILRAASSATSLASLIPIIAQGGISSIPTALSKVGQILHPNQTQGQQQHSDPALPANTNATADNTSAIRGLTVVMQRSGQGGASGSSNPLGVLSGLAGGSGGLSGVIGEDGLPAINGDTFGLSGISNLGSILGIGSSSTSGSGGFLSTITQDLGKIGNIFGDTSKLATQVPGGLFGAIKGGLNGTVGLSGTQELGLGLGAAGAGIGAFFGIQQASKGGAKNLASGIGTTAMSIAPFTGPAAPFVEAAGLIAKAVGAFLPDPRIQRQKEEEKRVFTQQYEAPPPINITVGANGGFADTDFKGGVRTTNLSPYPVVRDPYLDVPRRTVVPGGLVQQFGNENITGAKGVPRSPYGTIDNPIIPPTGQIITLPGIQVPPSLGPNSVIPPLQNLADTLSPIRNLVDSLVRTVNNPVVSTPQNQIGTRTSVSTGTVESQPESNTVTGRSSPLIQVTVHAMDHQSFINAAPNIIDAIDAGLRQGHGVTLTNTLKQHLSLTT